MADEEKIIFLNKTYKNHYKKIIILYLNEKQAQK
jgi:hypothetical protein